MGPAVKAFIDIGELGWSLYLSAHVRWLREKKEYVSVITYWDRRFLYENLADEILIVPDEFTNQFSECQQDGFGLRTPKGKRVPHMQIVNFLNRFFPELKTFLSDEFILRCHNPFKNKMLFGPYLPNNPEKTGFKIVIFPRKRSGEYEKRNLPIQFYKELIETLSRKFGDSKIVTIGNHKGSYQLGKSNLRCHNFTDLVDDRDIGFVVDQLSGASYAIGSASALPKLSLLQGVPTVIVGHDKKRVVEENWMKTRMLFLKNDNYGVVELRYYLTAIMRFINESRGVHSND
jgi:hypothetical protein